MVSNILHPHEGGLVSPLLLTTFPTTKGLGEHVQMDRSDLERILALTDRTLDVFRQNEGKLSALEISLRSMLAVVRAQVAEQVAERSIPEA